MITICTEVADEPNFHADLQHVPNSTVMSSRFGPQ
jgi:hypothetical protein